MSKRKTIDKNSELKIGDFIQFPYNETAHDGVLIELILQFIVSIIGDKINLKDYATGRQYTLPYKTVTVYKND